MECVVRGESVMQTGYGEMCRFPNFPAWWSVLFPLLLFVDSLVCCQNGLSGFEWLVVLHDS